MDKEVEQQIDRLIELRSEMKERIQKHPKRAKSFARSYRRMMRNVLDPPPVKFVNEDIHDLRAKTKYEIEQKNFCFQVSFLWLALGLYVSYAVMSRT